MSKKSDIRVDVERVLRDSNQSRLSKAGAEAVLLQKQGRIEEALEKWKSYANEMAEIDEELAALVWYPIGRTKEDRKDFEGSIEAFDKLILLSPAFVEAYRHRGYAKAMLNQHAAAIADFDEAIRLDPDDASTYDRRGSAKVTLGRYAAAIADFDEAIRLNPDDASAHYNRGIAKANLNRIYEARQDFETMLNLARAAGDADMIKLAKRVLAYLNRYR